MQLLFSALTCYECARETGLVLVLYSKREWASVGGLPRARGLYSCSCAYTLALQRVAYTLALQRVAYTLALALQLRGLLLLGYSELATLTSALLLPE
jgi:hypothetical protein